MTKQPVFIEKKMNYLVYGKETCPTTNKLHWQGYVEFKNQYTWSAIKKMWAEPGLHLAARKGTPAQASDYCKKVNQEERCKRKNLAIPLPNEEVYEFGQISAPGKRKDMEIVREHLKANKPMEELVHMVSYQGMRAAEMILKYCEEKRTWKPDVIWIYGASDSGKSSYVLGKHPDAYVKDCNMGSWWQGYDGNEVVLFDELRNGNIPFTTILRLLDRYPCRVETKGGSRQFRAKTIYVTSQNPPEDFVPDNENARQLLRRIDTVIQFNSAGYLRHYCPNTPRDTQLVKVPDDLTIKPKRKLREGQDPPRKDPPRLKIRKSNDTSKIWVNPPATI
jgi:hypothetical protein